MPRAAIIEQFSIRIALGNNGGTWAEHYTEEQKNHWRKLTADLVKDLEIDLSQRMLKAIAEYQGLS